MSPMSDHWDRPPHIVSFVALPTSSPGSNSVKRDEAIRRRPRAPYAWDGVAEVRPFGAMEKNIVEGVY